ncbi:uncharacterized protein [Linepithema humile]|uniref:uncharacterized protein n=1 Tax=Linepithema humile TaxID=83485 RepID=UPI00351E1262
MAADGPDPKPCRLVITERQTKVRYLIDTGSDISVYPRSMVRGRMSGATQALFAANGTVIHTYGWIALQLNIGLRRAFQWKFIVADVTQPIIGSNFLGHFHLLPDVRRGKLLDATTGLATNSLQSRTGQTSIKTLLQETAFHALLAEFPQLTRPTGKTESAPHSTMHYIETTPGPPEACRPRRLAPEN